MKQKLPVQRKHRKKVLKLRRLDYIVQSPEFVTIWLNSDRVDRNKLLNLIEAINPTGLQKIIDSKIKEPSIRQLRRLAALNHISYYSRLPRQELIIKLIEKGVLNADARLRTVVNKPIERDESITCGCWGRSETNQYTNSKTTYKVNDKSLRLVTQSQVIITICKNVPYIQTSTF